MSAFQHRVCMYCGAVYHSADKLGEHWAKEHRGKPVEQPVETKKKAKKKKV